MRARSATKGRDSSLRKQTTAQVQVPSAGPRLHFQIERITLDGYARGTEARFVNSLKQSLAALAKARQFFSWPRVSRKLASLAAGQLRPGASPEEAGRYVARQIVAALSRRAGGNARV